MPVFPLRRPRHLAHTLRRGAAALLAVAALLLALRPPAEPPPVAVTGSPLVVAAADLAAGTLLADEDLRTTEVPAAAVPDGSATEVSALVGGVLASPVRAGEPVTDARLVGPGLWSQAPAGQVATPVRLADLAVTGLLRAGDRVAVLATRSAVDDPAGGAGTEVVVRDALVLAVPAADRDDGLLVLGVSEAVAAALATAAGEATLTVTLGPP